MGRRRARLRRGDRRGGTGAHAGVPRREPERPEPQHVARHPVRRQPQPVPRVRARVFVLPEPRDPHRDGRRRIAPARRDRCGRSRPWDRSRRAVPALGRDPGHGRVAHPTTRVPRRTRRRHGPRRERRPPVPDASRVAPRRPLAAWVRTAPPPDPSGRARRGRRAGRRRRRTARRHRPTGAWRWRPHGRGAAPGGPHRRPRRGDRHGRPHDGHGRLLGRGNRQPQLLRPPHPRVPRPLRRARLRAPDLRQARRRRAVGGGVGQTDVAPAPPGAVGGHRPVPAGGAPARDHPGLPGGARGASPPGGGDHQERPDRARRRPARRTGPLGGGARGGIDHNARRGPPAAPRAADQHRRAHGWRRSAP